MTLEASALEASALEASALEHKAIHCKLPGVLRISPRPLDRR
jgi:hypothetical protein